MAGPDEMESMLNRAPVKITPDVRRILDQAKALEANPPRKHHLIPDSYLKRWAIDGQIRVTEATTRYSYKTSPANAGRETDFYRIEDPNLDPEVLPPLLFEHLLSKIEDRAIPGIDHLLAFGLEGLKPDDGVWLAIYMAFQFTRGRAFRAEQLAFMQNFFRVQHPATTDHARWLVEQAGELPTSERVAKALEGLRAIHDGSIVVSKGPAGMIGMGGEAAEVLVPQFLLRDWFVYRSDLSPIITSDEPIVVIDGPNGDRSTARRSRNSGSGRVSARPERRPGHVPSRSPTHGRRSPTGSRCNRNRRVEP